ncbi:Siderophore biosynthesis non-ribosomal peptide synthetase [Enhygromyxa salina]|uniref:Siderophore biosynthesis non-ribosomal peptide synthetase n=2 Tax=Enhygromyxa salina TaxID=215803 RepID=A0A0C1ZLS2_9BACT|nr:Siderophore biosynthesis non-ribosomal peptide synthetase [Enhygromyxa salina]
MYGPTETTIWSLVDRVRAGEPVTIGRPIGNTRCHVLDERRESVPPGVPGELYLSGDGLARGYLGREELSAARFVVLADGDRAYRTGDLVRALPDGRLEYLERIDGQIKLNGYRIELGEIETALRRSAGVAEAVAVLREDQPGERRLVAYVVPAAASAPLEPAALRAGLGASLPDYMVPAAIVTLHTLPLTLNGKIDREALPAPVLRRARSGEVLRGETEEQIAGVWSEVLGLDWVEPNDNFFDLGGDSLKLTAVTARLAEQLGRPVSRLSMFAHPTVRAMARHLVGEAPAAGRPRRTRDLGALAQRRGRSRRIPRGA